MDTNDNRNKDRDTNHYASSGDSGRHGNDHHDRDADHNSNVNWESGDSHSSGSNSQDLERKWNSISTDYRKRYPNITSEDVDYRQGEFDNMTERIAKRTNRSRQQVSQEIQDWNSDNR